MRAYHISLLQTQDQLKVRHINCIIKTKSRWRRPQKNDRPIMAKCVLNNWTFAKKKWLWRMQIRTELQTQKKFSQWLSAHPKINYQCEMTGPKSRCCGMRLERRGATICPWPCAVWSGGRAKLNDGILSDESTSVSGWVTLSDELMPTAREEFSD